MNVPLTLGQRLEASGSSAVGHALSAGRDDEISGKPVRAAQYVRMSTDHQKYSTGNQSEAMQLYAARRGIEIVRTYADQGKSGLNLEDRDALKQLIEDVQAIIGEFAYLPRPYRSYSSCLPPAFLTLLYCRCVWVGLPLGEPVEA